MAGKVDWKSKYLELRSKYMNAIDVGFRLGVEEGTRNAEMEALQMQVQQMEEQAAMEAEAAMMGGEEGAVDEMGMPIEEEMPEEEKKEAVPEEKLISQELKESESKLIDKENRYLEKIGRRKTAVARVRLWTKGKKEILVNSKPYKNYFQDFELQQIFIAPLVKMKCVDRFRILIQVKGGGFRSQSEATRLGIARVLVDFNPDFRKRLKRVGYLTRDSRMRERKKFGLKRARRAPQWQKR